jgi:hypothetical protein
VHAGDRLTAAPLPLIPADRLDPSAAATADVPVEVLG